MKKLPNGISTRYYKQRYIPLDCDSRLFMKEVKLHWWSFWKPITLLTQDKTKKYLVTYYNDPIVGMSPTKGYLWNYEHCMKN